MSNPRFAVGDLVGLCSKDLGVVIPETTVIRRTFKEAAFTFNRHGEVWKRPAGYWYVVAAMPKSNDKTLWWFESSLRPILPGEYTEDTQDLHAPIEEGAQ